MRIVTNQCLDSGIVLDGFTAQKKVFEPLHKAVFLDPLNLVTSCYWIWWSTIREFSLMLLLETPEKRNILNGSILADKNYHEWALSAEDREILRLPLRMIDSFAYFTLNDVETRFFVVSKRWEEKLISRGIGSYFEKICDVYFVASLYPCCRSNLGLVQPPRRMATHKAAQPLAACSSLL